MSDDSINARNPTGIKFTQEQQDGFFRQSYWSSAIDYGLQYYVAGRFATANRFTPVCANLLHHAVELLLKACLSYDDSAATIETYGHSKGRYGHNIPALWAAFKKRQLDPMPREFDMIVKALHDFEDIRYPEKLVRNGATIMINPFVEESISANNQEIERSYNLSLPPIDRLIGFLFKVSHANPDAFLDAITDKHGMGSVYYEKIKMTLFGRTPV